MYQPYDRDQFLDQVEQLLRAAGVEPRRSEVSRSQSAALLLRAFGVDPVLDQVEVLKRNADQSWPDADEARAASSFREIPAKTRVRPRGPLISRFATTRYARERRESGSARGAFDAEMTEHGHESRTDLVQWGEVAAPEKAAEALRLTAGESVAIRKRHMYADQTPVQVATSYVPWSLAEGTAITEKDTGPGGTYSRLADVGHPVERFTEAVRVRVPASDEAAFLQLEEDQAVYEVLHTAWDAEDDPIEICFHVMPTSQWILHYEWPAT